MKSIKKILAIVLTAILCLSVMPSFVFAEDVLLSEAFATITEPEVGGHPDFAPVSGEPEKYSVQVNIWYKYESPYPELNGESVFEAGSSYALRFTFTPLSGYTFDSNTVFRINGKSTSCYGSTGNREYVFYFPQDVFNVTTANELAYALSRSNHIKEINITSDFTVNTDCMVYFDGDKLNYYHDTVININEGVTLTIENGGIIGSFWPSYEGDWETPPLPNCRIINNGTVIVENGGSTQASFAVNNGNIIVKGGGSAVVVDENYGNVTVEEGASYRTTQGDDAKNHGIINLNRGAEMEARFGTSIINCEDGKIVLNGTFRCNSYSDKEGTGHFWFENQGVVEGNGDIIIAAADSKAMPVNDKDVMIEKMMVQLGQEKRYENWDDVNIYKLEEASTFEELETYLGAKRTIAGEPVEGNMDIIVLITEDITIPEGKEIAVMSKVILDTDKRLIIENGALLECGLENHGMVTVRSGGMLYTTMGGNIENHANLSVLEGGTIRSQMGGEVVNLPDASLVLNGEFYCGCIGDGMWFKNGGEVSGTGAIILYEAAHDFLPVNDFDALKANAEAAIAGGDPLPEVRIAPTPGDINGDREVDNKDLIRLFQYLSEWGVEVNEATLDVNGDQAVDNKDLIRLFQYLSEWGVEIF